jgi:transcriptional regulator with XRE-family HTH domain
VDSIEDALRRARVRRRLPPPPARRQIRQRADLTQRDLAVAVGVDRATVARWEAGDREPRACHLERYLAVLDRLAREPLTAAASAASADGSS